MIVSIPLHTALQHGLPRRIGGMVKVNAEFVLALFSFRR
jgi:hypothetical protein